MKSELLIILGFVILLSRADDAPENSTKFELSKSDEDFLKEKGIDIKLVHGTATIKQRNQSKRDTSGELDIEYHFTNGTVVKMTVKQQSNDLATKSTRVWRSTGLGKAFYHDQDCKAMEDVGEFSFYHDPNHIVALVYFHKDETVQGFYYTYELIGKQKQPDESGTSYFLVHNAAFGDHIGAGGSALPTTKPPTSTRESPETVYPQILIVLTKKSARNSATQAIRSALAYWNAVDMLLSSIKKPKIKISIGGLVLPQNDAATPWMSHLKDDNLEMAKAHDAVGDYFKATDRFFYDEEFDLIVGMTPVGLREAGSDGAVLAKAHASVPCSDRNHRSAILSESCSYLAATHEIAHLFGAQRDQDSGCPSIHGVMSKWEGEDPASFQWSTCAQDSISAHFKNDDTKCYDNVPTPLVPCYSDSSSESTPVPSDVCAQGLLQICKSKDYDQFLLDPYWCGGQFWCSSPTSPGAETYVAVDVADGAVCQWGIDGTVAKVCYKGKCETYDNSNATCPPVA